MQTTSNADQPDLTDFDSVQTLIATAQTGAAYVLERQLAAQIRNNPDALKPYAVFFGNVLAARRFPWNLVRTLVPKRSNWLETSGWRRSLLESKPVDQNGSPIPWWTYPAIDWIASRVRSDWRVFEWGSGHSTLWWATRVASIHAIEHNLEWYSKVANQAPDNVTVQHAAEEADYVRALQDLENDAVFDVIVIDGLRRDLCAAEIQDSVAPKGLVILDNSDVAKYSGAIETLEKSGFYRIDFYGLIPSYMYKNCTSVFFRDPSILNESTRPPAFQSGLGPTVQQGLMGW